MKALAGKVALVTGAASGIGRATALALAQEGSRLVLADVNETLLRAVELEVAARAPCLLARAVDVSKREAMEAFARSVHQTVPSIDILVNNAGVYLTGSVLDLSLDDWEWSLSANLWSVIHGAHFFVPPMVERGAGGHVVNVVSMYGYWPAPGVIGYLTAKFGVFGFSEALREDLRGSGIGVSTVCPGMVRTNLVQNMRVRTERPPETKRAHLQNIYERRNYGPEKVACAIVNAIRHDRKIVLVSPEARVMYYLERWCPPVSRVIARMAARRMFL